MKPSQLFEVEAGAAHRARHQVLHEHVGAADQPREQIMVVRVFDVENDGFLAAVEPYEIAALSVGGTVVAARKIAFRPLDLDNPGTGIREAASAQRRGDRLLDRNHQHSFERPTHFLLQNCTHEAPVEATTFPPIFGT